MKCIKLVALVLAMAVVVAVCPICGAAAGDSSLVITEVCFNPTYKENSAGLEKNADVFEFVEVVNRSDKAVSLADVTLQYSKAGYGGSFACNEVLAVSDSPRVLKAGEVAVFALYNERCATLGLQYGNDDQLRDFFVEFEKFYDLAQDMHIDRFYVCPSVESGNSTAISNAFTLDNKSEDAVVAVVGADGKYLCSAAYSPSFWNANNTAVNFKYDGGSAKHPEESSPTMQNRPTPGRLFDNQRPGVKLTPSENTISLRMLQYNLCCTTEYEPWQDSGMYLKDRAAFIFNVIRNHDPDIMGLCEVNGAWIRHMNKDLLEYETTEYDAFGYSNIGSKYGDTPGYEQWDMHSLILWKWQKYDKLDGGAFWYTNDDIYFPGIFGETAQAQVGSWVILREKATGTELFVVSTHMGGEAMRERAAEVITSEVNRLSGGRPVIIVADWNCGDTASPMRTLYKNGWVDIRHRAPSADSLMKLNSLPIDNCIVSKQGVYLEKFLMDRAYLKGDSGARASDHNCMVYDLKIRQDMSKATTTTVTTTVPTTTAPTTTVADATVPSTAPTATDTTVPSTVPSVPETPSAPAAAFPMAVVWIGGGVLLAGGAAVAIVLIIRRKKR